MKKLLHYFNSDIVKIEITGNKVQKGSIIDSSKDLLVIFNGDDFIYIPFEHILTIVVDEDKDNEIPNPSEPPSIISTDDNKDLTLKTVLTQAKERFVEIYISGSQSLHGYISEIKNDYFIFHSPIYKTVFIAIDHLKWLIPYATDERPYQLEIEQLRMEKLVDNLPTTFYSLISNMKGKLIIFNLDEKNKHIGKLNDVKGKLIELQPAKSSLQYVNLVHIKTVQEV